MHWYTMKVSAGSGTMYRHVVIALPTYHLSSVSNLHLILANLLGLCVRGLGSQVLVSITE